MRKLLFGLCLLLTSAAQAATPEQGCEAAKSKAVGKKAACIANERAKEVNGRTADYTKCDTRFLVAFNKAEARALDRGGSCPTTGDAEAIAARIDVQFDPATGITSAVSGVRFIDNGDGTVSDTQTCLMWEKKDNLDLTSDLNNPHDADNKYTWGTQTAASGTIFSDFLHRLNFCTWAGTGEPLAGGFAGYCDWRLPSVLELQTIQGTLPGCSSADLCIDPIFGPTQGGPPSFDLGEYVSSTALNLFPASLHAVFFRGPTGAGSFDKTVPGYVRAVRGVNCSQ